jgi:hypothetical protein
MTGADPVPMIALEVPNGLSNTRDALRVPASRVLKIRRSSSRTSECFESRSLRINILSPGGFKTPDLDLKSYAPST